MKQVLGSKLWMWPFPFAPEIKGQGLFFPKIPDVTETDIDMRSGVRTSETAISEPDYEIDPQSYIDKAVDKYAGNMFVLTEKDPESEQETVKTFKIDRADALAENRKQNEIEEDY